MLPNCCNPHNQLPRQCDQKATDDRVLKMHPNDAAGQQQDWRDSRGLAVSLGRGNKRISSN